jgi:H+/Cl- antiporter ClcA
MPTLAGLIFGSIGYALPLTLGDGAGHLPDIIQHHETLGLHLVLCTAFAKMITFAASYIWGFVGGVLIPTIFIGIVFGVAVHMVFPEIALVLSLACMMCSVPAGFAPIPMTLALLPVFILPCSAHQAVILLAPVFISQITCYTLNDGLFFHYAVQMVYPREKQQSGEVTAKDLARDTGFY